MPEVTQEANAVVAGMLGQMGVEEQEAEEPQEAPEAEATPEVEEPQTPGEAIEGEVEQEFDAKTDDVTDEDFSRYAPVSEEEFAEFEEEEAEETLSELRERLEVSDEEDSEYEDSEELDELRAHVTKLEKALNYQKNLRAKQQEGGWRKEAAEKYPLAAVDSIKADSRRAYLRAAAESHNLVYKHLQPHIDKLEAEKKKVIEATKAEARAEAADAWGKPTAGHTGGEVDEAQFQSELTAARSQNDLSKVLGVMRKYNRE